MPLGVPLLACPAVGAVYPLRPAGRASSGTQLIFAHENSRLRASLRTGGCWRASVLASSVTPRSSRGLQLSVRSVRADRRRVVQQEVARAAGGVVRVRHLASRRSLVERRVFGIAAAVRAEAARAATGNAAAAWAATAAGDPFRQSAAGSAAAATFAAAAAFAAVDVATSEFAVAGVFAEELANRSRRAASDERSAAVGGDAAAIAAASRVGAAASQQA